MKVLVTGASGFLGTALCRALLGRGDDVMALNSRNCPLTRADSLLRFNFTRYDYIYHLAAWTQAGDFCLHHPGEQWIVNQLINTHVVQWWQQHQAQAKLIAIGTSCSYAPDTVMVEENYLCGHPIESLYTYAMTKRMLQMGLMAMQRQYGLRYLTLVPSTLYGPGYHSDGRQMHFIFDLVRKILRGKYHGEQVVLWGDGQQRRELIYVLDFVSAMLQLAQVRENEIINVGAGEEYSIAYYARRICQIVGWDFAAIGFDTSKYIGARSKCLGVEKLRAILPGLQLTPLDDGLRETIAWMENHPAVLEPTAARSVA